MSKANETKHTHIANGLNFSLLVTSVSFSFALFCDDTCFENSLIEFQTNGMPFDLKSVDSSPVLYGTVMKWNWKTYGNSSASVPGKLILGDNGERCFFSNSCKPGGACTGLKMVSFRFGGAKNPPDNVNCVRMLPLVDEHERNPSIVSADFDIKMAADCCNPFDKWSDWKWWSSSICCDVLRIHLSVRPDIEIPPLALSVDECADVERTNWRMCFCWAVKNAPCDEDDESGCCKKLVNLLFMVPPEDELVVVVLENFCTCFSVTILTVDCAFNCCTNVDDAPDNDCWSIYVDAEELDDCKLWLRVFDLFVLVADFTLFTVVAVDVEVVVDNLSSSSSSFGSPGAVIIYFGGSASSTDMICLLIFVHFAFILNIFLFQVPFFLLIYWTLRKIHYL